MRYMFDRAARIYVHIRITQDVRTGPAVGELSTREVKPAHENDIL